MQSNSLGEIRIFTNLRRRETPGIKSSLSLATDTSFRGSEVSAEDSSVNTSCTQAATYSLLRVNEDLNSRPAIIGIRLFLQPQIISTVYLSTIGSPSVPRETYRGDLYAAIYGGK